MEMKQNVKAAPEQYIVIKFDKEQYGINIKYVNNIVRMQRMTRVPKAPDYIKGVINLRGEIIPVMSLRTKFGLSKDIYINSTRIIIVKLDPEFPIGLVVDEVREVVQLDDDNVIKKVNEDTENNYLLGIGKYNDELITLLNLSEILNEKDFS